MFLHISVTIATISCLRLFWYIPIIFGFLLKHFWYSPCSLLILPKHLTLASCDPLFLWLCYLDNVSFYITSLNEREKEEVCTHHLSDFQKQFWLWTFKSRCMPIDIQEGKDAVSARIHIVTFTTFSNFSIIQEFTCLCSWGMRIIRKDPSSLSIYQHISLVETHIHTQLMFSLHLPKTFLGSSSFPHCPHPDQQLLRIPKLFHSPWFRFKAKTPFCIPFLPSKQMPVYGPLRNFILLTHKNCPCFIFL